MSDLDAWLAVLRSQHIDLRRLYNGQARARAHHADTRHMLLILEETVVIEFDEAQCFLVISNRAAA